MGKRSMERMTGMTREERVKAAIKRQERERKIQAKIAAEMMTRVMLGLGAMGKSQDIDNAILPLPNGAPMVKPMVKLTKGKEETDLLIAKPQPARLAEIEARFLKAKVNREEEE